MVTTAAGRAKATAHRRRPLDEALRVLVRQLDHSKSELELLIAATPTGPRRNELCDANLHLGEALRLIVRGDLPSERMPFGAR